MPASHEPPTLRARHPRAARARAPPVPPSRLRIGRTTPMRHQGHGRGPGPPGEPSTSRMKERAKAPNHPSGAELTVLFARQTEYDSSITAVGQKIYLRVNSLGEDFGPNLGCANARESRRPQGFSKPPHARMEWHRQRDGERQSWNTFARSQRRDDYETHSRQWAQTRGESHCLNKACTSSGRGRAPSPRSDLGT